VEHTPSFRPHPPRRTSEQRPLDGLDDRASLADCAVNRRFAGRPQGQKRDLVAPRHCHEQLRNCLVASIDGVEPRW
jgi:hypothetical protein